MADFDLTTKQIFKKHTTDLVQFVLSENAEVIEVLDVDLPIVEDRSADGLAKVKFRDREVLVHIEFQTTAPKHRCHAEWLNILDG